MPENFLVYIYTDLLKRFCKKHEDCLVSCVNCATMPVVHEGRRGPESGDVAPFHLWEPMRDWVTTLCIPAQGCPVAIATSPLGFVRVVSVCMHQIPKGSSTSNILAYNIPSLCMCVCVCLAGVGGSPGQGVPESCQACWEGPEGHQPFPEFPSL